MTLAKILLADDDAVSLQEIGHFLKRNGYAVVAVEDGYQALEAAVRHEPDMLILDVHMPAGDGFSVQERVAHHAELRLCPVVYMTHDTSERTREVAVHHGTAAILYKPFEMGRLLEVIRAICEESGLEAA